MANDHISAKNGWLNISDTSERGVLGNHTVKATKAVVRVPGSAIRSGPDFSFPVVMNYQQGEEVFVCQTKGIWCHIGLHDLWLSSADISVQ